MFSSWKGLSSNPTNLSVLHGPFYLHWCVTARWLLGNRLDTYSDVISMPDWQTQTHSEKSTNCWYVPMVTRTNRSQLLTEDGDLCRPVKENTYTQTHSLCVPTDANGHTHAHIVHKSHTRQLGISLQNIFLVINGDGEYKNTMRRPETAECLSNQVRERKANLPKPCCGKAHS